MASVATGTVNSRIRSAPFLANQIRSQKRDFAREFGVQRLQSFVFSFGPILALRARRDAQGRKNAKPKRDLEVIQRCAGRVAVIGAGPAGLAAALALRRDGLDVNIYERSPELRLPDSDCEFISSFKFQLRNGEDLGYSTDCQSAFFCTNRRGCAPHFVFGIIL